MPHSERPVAEILYCPPADAGGLISEIRNRGNVPVCFGHSSIVELTPADIRENWQTTRSLRRQVAGAMASELGQRLWRSFVIDEDDDVDHAGEAAACLFLALHHSAVPLRHALAGCRILWDQRSHCERVECLTAI